MPLLSHSFLRAGVRVQLCRAEGWGSHLATIKVLIGAVVSSDTDTLTREGSTFTPIRVLGKIQLLVVVGLWF